jgi:ribosomal-protein-alanine N-acetyltransferase
MPLTTGAETRGGLTMSDLGEIAIRAPSAADGPAFTAAMRASAQLHADWVVPARDLAAYAGWLARGDDGRCVHRLVLEDGRLAGYATLSEIARGGFQNAFLSYTAVEAAARRGAMTAGLRLVLDEAFGPLALHRVEANIQPDNAPSLALVRRLGFVREGFSEAYLMIAGRWRDHERWALRAEQWAGAVSGFKAGYAPGP